MKEYIKSHNLQNSLSLLLQTGPYSWTHLFPPKPNQPLVMSRRSAPKNDTCPAPVATFSLNLTCSSNFCPHLFHLSGLRCPTLCHCWQDKPASGKPLSESATQITTPPFALSEEHKRVFDPARLEKEASHSLSVPGSPLDTEYVIDFQHAAADSILEWCCPVQCNLLRTVWTTHTTQLASPDLHNSLNKLIKLASCIDRRFQECHSEKDQTCPLNFRLSRPGGSIISHRPVVETHAQCSSCNDSA